MAITHLVHAVHAGWFRLVLLLRGHGGASVCEAREITLRRGMQSMRELLHGE